MGDVSLRVPLDVRRLPQTRESLVCTHGGLFPVLAVAPCGTIVAVFRGGAGHLGRRGRLDVARSHDAGRTWSPPSVVVDGKSDDRNPALGVSADGRLVLAYEADSAYDEQGRYRPPSKAADGDWGFELRLTSSTDAGLTWEAPRLGDERVRKTSPYGKIVTLEDGTLLLSCYGRSIRGLDVDGRDEPAAGSVCSYLLCSRDGGRTFGEPRLIAEGANETGLLALPNGELVAAYRAHDADAALVITRTADLGATWSTPSPTTGPFEHPADLLLLRDGRVLLVYGNRRPPYRIEGRLSRDGSRTFEGPLLCFSGPLYGSDPDWPGRSDIGYPASVVDAGRGVTVYYQGLPVEGQDEEEARYSPEGYRAIAVSWSEDELLACVG